VSLRIRINSLQREEVLTKEGRNKSKIDTSMKFHLLHLSMVREYLELEFKTESLPFPFDLERVIDDFVLMCFFIGNDFLPSLPGNYFMHS
jgi:5'-3' exoribonuclease 1